MSVLLDLETLAIAPWSISRGITKSAKPLKLFNPGLPGKLVGPVDPRWAPGKRWS